MDIGVKERAKSLLQSVLKQLCCLECSQTIMYLEIRIVLGIILYERRSQRYSPYCMISFLIIYNFVS